MSIYRVTFSPTGGTDKSAEIIAAPFGPSEKIDLTDREYEFSDVCFNEDDVVIVAMPSYRGLAPDPALDRFGLMQGNGAKCILVAVYGNRLYEDTLVQMEDVADAAGFRVVAAIGSIAEHSVVREFGSGRPDKKDKEVLTEFAEKIIRKIDSGDFTKPSIPGNRPYKEVPPNRNLIPTDEDKCIGCGTCVDMCPTGAMKENPFDINEFECIGCMRCQIVCPVDAKGYTPEQYLARKEKLAAVCSGYKENDLHL